LWSFQIGVQKNDIDAPSLVTSIDRVFNVTCDYADLIENGSPIPPTDNEIDEAKSARIEMQILQNGEPVTTVPLGEVVELRWRILDPSNGLGYFIETCVAERVGGAPPQPEPLTIIQHG
uniref:ZP domain-containing protein n=1 Tax=Heligmosomoides polygyrus TaxID=6339 RepID=A0A183GFW8_HELPZ